MLKNCNKQCTLDDFLKLGGGNSTSENTVHVLSQNIGRKIHLYIHVYHGINRICALNNFYREYLVEYIS